MSTSKHLSSSALAAKAGQEIIKYLVEAVRKDRANRYALTKPWVLPRISRTLPDYEDELFLIRNSVITVKTYSGDVCDGASLAPDRIGPWRLVIGSLFHDPWYDSMHRMSVAWDMPVREVRLIGDDVYYGILILISPRWIARTYYRVVRLLGGSYHFLARSVAVGVIIALCCAGCSGCSVPNDIFDNPDDFVLPDYEQTVGMLESN